MLKKLDKLILKIFFGPFFLTFGIVLFIFLTQYMIKNLKHLVGKGLGLDIYGELFFYFAMVLTPVALPLAVLLSTLMTFGSLGEHSELTAIKSSGISLLRILRPVAVFIVLLTAAAFYFNDQISPWANLKAYSLLYDIKQKKPVLEFKEEVFYSDMPNYRIKIGKKHLDGETLEDVIIYNHTDRRGNVQVIMAETGKMKTKGDYLVLDLKNGNIYSEESAKKRNSPVVEFFRQDFDSASFLFSMESYGLKDTKEEFFKGHNLMKTTGQLFQERDSARDDYNAYMANFQKNIFSYYSFWQRREARPDENPNQELQQKISENNRARSVSFRPGQAGPDSKVFTPETEEEIEWVNPYQPKDGKLKETRLKTVSVTPEELQQVMQQEADMQVYSRAVSRSTSILNALNTNTEKADRQSRLINNYYIDIHRKFTKSVAVLMMFLIGAPLGAIIKKGGLGVPVLISIIFFVIFYISTIMGEKYAKEMVLDPVLGCWIANIILFGCGLFFLRQARTDARLFDVDYYYVLMNKLKEHLPVFWNKTGRAQQQA